MPSVNIAGFGTVKFPDGMTPEQITSAIERDILPSLKQKAAPEAVRQEAPTFLERVGRGASDTVDRAVQLGMNAGEKLGLKGYPDGLSDVATQQMNAEQASYQKGRTDNGRTGTDWARIIGQAGMTAPMALVPGGASTVPRILSGAATGAASGAMLYDPSNSALQGLKNVAVGAGIGAIVNPIAGKIADEVPGWISAIKGKVQGLVQRSRGAASDAAILNSVPELASVPASMRGDLIDEARSMIKNTGALDAGQLGRKANLVANDVTPTKSMVTRNPADWTLERNLQKLAQSPDETLSSVGGQLTDVYQANDAALTRKLGTIGGNLPKGSAEQQGMTVMQKLDQLSSASQKDVGKIYEQIRATSGGDLASDAKNLSETLAGLQDSTYAEKMVSSVNNKLKRFGMMDAEGKLTTNTLTVNQSEELRKFVNTLPNDYGKRDIIRAIDADVIAGAGGDAFQGARKAASDRFSMLDNPATQKALNTLGELQQGKTAQNFIRSQVVNAPAQDVATLVKTLGSLQPADKKTAMEALKAGVIDHLQSKAVNQNSGQFSGAALNKALASIGDDKLKLVLGAEDLAKLQSLARASIDSTYAPAYSAVNNSNTAPMLLSLTQRARAIPGVPLLVSEEAQKLAARSGYQGQLANALSAQATSANPTISPVFNQLSASAAGFSTPAVNALLNERRKKANPKN